MKDFSFSIADPNKSYTIITVNFFSLVNKHVPLKNNS